MNKSELEYIKNRIETVVKCTNGEIATRLERIKKGTGLTDARKFKMIQEGKATVLDEHEIVELEDNYGHRRCWRALLDCFTYPETVIQAEKREFNARIERKKDELMQEVTLEGKRLIDSIVLGLVELKDVPEELHRLGSMSSLTRGFISDDFMPGA